MAKFTNDLSMELSMVQHEEILESLTSKYTRQKKEMIVKTGILTGAIVASGTIGLAEGKPEVILITMASLGIANSLYHLYIQNKKLKPYKIDYKNIESIDYRALAKSQRERDRYNGKLQPQAPYRYEKAEKEEIEEEFGYSSDNDLPIHFLEKDLVPERVLHEYDLYSKKYEVPQLNVSKDIIVDFVNKLSELLKKVNLSHRIYFYTSEYFKRLICKGLINYWDEINLDTFISQLDVFEGLEGLLPEDIEELKKQLKPEEKSKKLK